MLPSVLTPGNLLGQRILTFRERKWGKPERAADEHRSLCHLFGPRHPQCPNGLVLPTCALFSSPVQTGRGWIFSVTGLAFKHPPSAAARRWGMEHPALLSSPGAQGPPAGRDPGQEHPPPRPWAVRKVRLLAASSPLHDAHIS